MYIEHEITPLALLHGRQNGLLLIWVVFMCQEGLEQILGNATNRIIRVHSGQKHYSTHFLINAILLTSNISNSKKNLAVTGVPQLTCMYKCLYETGTSSYSDPYIQLFSLLCICCLCKLQFQLEEICNAVYQELIKCTREHATPILPNKTAKSKHGGHDCLSTSIYGISVTFADVINNS